MSMEQQELFGGGLQGAIQRSEAWAIALAKKAQRINRKAGYVCMSTPEGYEEALSALREDVEAQQ